MRLEQRKVCSFRWQEKTQIGKLLDPQTGNPNPFFIQRSTVTVDYNISTVDYNYYSNYKITIGWACEVVGSRYYNSDYI